MELESSKDLSSSSVLIRDYKRNWVIGFGMNIGVCSITIAQL